MALESNFFADNGSQKLEILSLHVRMPSYTGQRINELENGPSSYRLKKQFFGSNRLGFDIVKDLV